MKPIESLDQLRQMCYISALSGHEEDMIQYMKAEMLRFVPDVRVDRLGNVIACLPGAQANGPRVMISAHMDELGFMVRKIEEDGWVRLTRVGGVPEKSLPAQRLVLRGTKGDVFGVIGPKSHHLTPPEEKFKVTEINELYVDIGAHSNAEAEAMGIYPGTPVTYHGFFQEMPGGQFAGKALDDRAGCFVLLQLLRLLAGKKRAATVYFVASVQEEFNIRGVVTVGFAINPDMAIGLDVAVACDTPDLKALADIRLGGGPVISHYTFHGRGTLNGLIPNPRLRQYVTDTAARLGLPLQHSVFLGGLGETSYLAVVREGIPALDMAFPVRYTHAPIEVGSWPDMEYLIVLLAEVLNSIDSTLDLSRG
ncbi:MAG: M42 family metallopeptidase [Chloroflexi bacterium]|nr:M42 family metallopeptidase [Chloroflexota bacterium]